MRMDDLSKELVELIDRCANRALSGCPPISLVEVRPAG
jgi:hypothetical protein